MREVELVAVVRVRDAEVQRREEDGGRGGRGREQGEGREEGAEEEFFGEGPLGGLAPRQTECRDTFRETRGAGETHRHIIPPPHPVPQLLHHRPSPHPRAPPALDHPALEQRPREQQRGQQHGFRNLRQTDGPPAEQAQDLVARGVHVLREDVDGDERGSGTGERDELDARADDGGGVAGEVRGGPGGGVQVEGEDVEEGEGDLGGGLGRGWRRVWIEAEWARDSHG